MRTPSHPSVAVFLEVFAIVHTRPDPINFTEQRRDASHHNSADRNSTAQLRLFAVQRLPEERLNRHFAMISNFWAL